MQNQIISTYIKLTENLKKSKNATKKMQNYNKLYLKN